MKTNLKGNHRIVFYETSVHKYFAKFIGKHLCKAAFLIEFPEVCNFIKQKTGIGVFLWILQKF